MHKILETHFYRRHAILLCESYQRLFNKALLPSSSSLVMELYEADFALLSHGNEPDPVFNFGNRLALDLFEYGWGEFVQLPSRLSAKPLDQAERQRLLDTVSRQGFIEHYSGIRVASTGREFRIDNAVVWNVVDESGGYYGQAAKIVI